VTENKIYNITSLAYEYFVLTHVVKDLSYSYFLVGPIITK